VILSLIVTEIVEKLNIGCEPHQVVACLERCFHENHSTGKTESVFVPTVKAYFNVKIGQPRTFADTEPEVDHLVVASTPMQWKPDAGGLLPWFDGFLNVHVNAEAIGNCVAIVRGTYASVPGKSGKTLDKDFSVEVARKTAQRILQELRKICESISGPGAPEAAH